jgi:8-oxo-dGTP pyrophosphatase MutT (NUDIX family)
VTPWSDKRSQDGCRDCGAFFLDSVGLFDRDRVKVSWSDSPRPTNQQVEAAIEATWAEQTRLAAEQGRKLYNGRLCRMINCETQGPVLQMTLGEVSYKEFVGTNLTHAQLRYIHGPDVLANPLGVSAAVVTSDGYVLLGRRSDKVFSNPGLVHPVGGTVEPPAEAGRIPDPFQAMTDELYQELALPAKAVRRNVCLGVVRAKRVVQPEMVFEVRVDGGVEAIRAGAANAPDASEHDELIPVRDHPGAVVTYIEKNYSQLTAVAMATLLLHGQRHWGMGWMATARGYLREVI